MELYNFGANFLLWGWGELIRKYVLHINSPIHILIYGVGLEGVNMQNVGVGVVNMKNI
jgi:hypothetical protein